MRVPYGRPFSIAVTFLTAVTVASCADKAPAAKPATDYDAIRERAHDSHESLKTEEAKDH